MHHIHENFYAVDKLKSICKDVLCFSSWAVKESWLCDSVWHTCDRRCARYIYMYDSWCVTHVERCVSVCKELFCSIRRPAFHHILMIPHPAELSIFFFMSDISVHCPVNFPSKLYRYQVFVICPVKLIQYFLTYLDNTFMLKLW